MKNPSELLILIYANLNNGNVDRALADYHDFTLRYLPERSSEVATVQSQWSALKKERAAGIVSAENYDLAANKVRFSLAEGIKDAALSLNINIADIIPESVQGQEKRRIALPGGAVAAAIITGIFAIILFLLKDVWLPRISGPAHFEYTLELMPEDGAGGERLLSGMQIEITYGNESHKYVIDNRLKVSFSRTEDFGSDSVKLTLPGIEDLQICTSKHLLHPGEVRKVLVCRTGMSKSENPDKNKPVTEKPVDPKVIHPDSGTTEKDSVVIIDKLEVVPGKSVVIISCTEAYKAMIDGKEVIPENGGPGYIRFTTDTGTHRLTVEDQFKNVLVKNQELNFTNDSLHISGCGGHLKMMRLADFRKNFK
ncbi:MAG: hypothetical protein R3C61_04220 [Bacteroidia bacterium]